MKSRIICSNTSAPADEDEWSGRKFSTLNFSTQDNGNICQSMEKLEGLLRGYNASHLNNLPLVEC